MPTFVLWLTLEAQNVGEVAFDIENQQWCIDLKQSDGDETREGVYVCKSDEVELKDSRGTASFAMKWPDARHQASLTVQEVKGLTRNWTEADGDKAVPIVAFECRGMEPTKWTPTGTITVKSAGSGQVFEDVDLEEGEWADYDIKKDEPVEILSINSEFKLHR